MQSAATNIVTNRSITIGPRHPLYEQVMYEANGVEGLQKDYGTLQKLSPRLLSPAYPWNSTISSETGM